MQFTLDQLLELHHLINTSIDQCSVNNLDTLSTYQELETATIRAIKEAITQ